LKHSHQTFTMTQPINLGIIRGQSIKKPNFWNSEPTSAHSMLMMVVLCGVDFELYSNTSSITPCQLVIEPQPL
jgi:hypothetical protein